MKNLGIFALLLSLLLAAACTKKGPEDGAKAAGGTAALKVGLVLDKGGKDDKSFNSAAFQGATQAVKELGIELKDIECPDDAAFEPALTTLAERGFPLIIAIGFSQKDAVQKVSKKFPNTHFALVDAVVDQPNVRSLTFKEHEGSFLVGYLAGLETKTGTTGFVGGMDVAMIRRFAMGYEAGVKEAKKDAKVLINYVGITSDAWANPNRGKELALSQYGRGADIIFSAAGATNMGVFDAAEEKKKFAIGVDSNQNWVKPGLILTSMLKRVDVAVFDTIKSEKDGKFAGGLKSFGLADKGIDYAVDANNEKLVALHKDKLEKVRDDIVSGKIKVPDYYEIQKVK
ncbi:MAG: BMP family ABC transporter substrate-binding protein [Bdellovibrionia bacterium]